MTERPQVLLVAGLAALGAIVAVQELGRALERLAFARDAGGGLDGLPLTTDDEGEIA